MADGTAASAAFALKPVASAADSPDMQTLFTWIAYGLASLFFVACVVAWYEHLGRTQHSEGEGDWESPMPKAMSVDVQLDTLAAEARAEAASDVGERREALGGAITRMASGRGNGNGFGDTTPMILPGSTPAPDGERQQRRERNEAAAP